VIYLGWIAFTIYQFLSPQKESPRLRRLGYWFALSGVLNGVWLFAWHYDYLGLSVIIMLALLGTLIMSYLRLDVGRGQVGALERWCVDIPFGIYLGWISVATIANISTFLFAGGWNGFGLQPQIWTAIMLAVASFLGIAMALIRQDAAFLLVLVWSFAGIAVEQANAPLVMASAWISAIIALALAAYAVLMRRQASQVSPGL
jgi:hypothetical protein